MRRLIKLVRRFGFKVQLAHWWVANRLDRLRLWACVPEVTPEQLKTCPVTIQRHHQRGILSSREVTRWMWHNPDMCR